MSAPVDSVTDAITDITAALGNVSVSDASALQKEATSDEATDQVVASAAEGRRLYIGNLAYATTEGELQTFFSGYLIESISIPKNPRTDRPVGYAFVDLATPSEAERAITELSGKDILERKVSVQLARRPEPGSDKPTANGAEDTGAGAQAGRRKPSGRGRGKGRARTGRAARQNQSSTNETGTEDSTAKAEPQTDGNENQASTEPKKPKEKTPRPPRERHERGPPADGIPSKTKIMVANLPYDLSEEKLKELFAEYEPVSAKIALRPIPRFMVKKLLARNEPRKGRGFGFVTLGSHELQDKAVAEMNGKEIEGREIAVKIAIDSPDKISEEATAQPTDAPSSPSNEIPQTEGASATPECTDATAENAEAIESAA
ncbi:hypothetical protein K3495_g7989 [Podosphaera aphanis]|nr:hypothetical protein K3495_g7989 [Podosphaera aphanis]